MLKQMSSIAAPERNEDEKQESAVDDARGSKITIKSSALTGML